MFKIIKIFCQLRQTNLQMNKKDYEQFMRHCQFVQKLSEDRSLLRVMQTQELMVLRHLKYASSDMISILGQQKELNHQHLQSVIEYCQISSDCIAVFTQYSTHTLQQEIQARRKTNNHFTLQELENILVSVVKALCYLQSKSIGHGCISTKDIVVSQNGTVKLIDPSLASSSPFNLISGYYYSPELLYSNSTQLQKNSAINSISQLQNQNIDFFKNDIFVTGMLVVEIGLLHTRLQQCIKYDQGCIDYQVVQKYLNEFQCLFSHAPFINLLCGMLQQDPQTRFTSQEVLNFIQEQFDESQQDEYEQQYMQSSYGSSYLQLSKNKTVKSFLLSQGPVQSVGQSLNSSKQSMLIENPIRTNRFSLSKNQRSKKVPLIQC